MADMNIEEFDADFENDYDNNYSDNVSDLSDVADLDIEMEIDNDQNNQNIYLNKNYPIYENVSIEARDIYLLLHGNHNDIAEVFRVYNVILIKIKTGSKSEFYAWDEVSKMYKGQDEPSVRSNAISDTLISLLQVLFQKQKISKKEYTKRKALFGEGNPITQISKFVNIREHPDFGKLLNKAWGIVSIEAKILMKMKIMKMKTKKNNQKLILIVTHRLKHHLLGFIFLI
eukprot:281969_1